MRWCWLLLLPVLLWPALSLAQCPGVTTQLTPYAKETLVIASTATALTPSIYQPPGQSPALAQLTVEGGDIRYQVVGNPTIALGHHVPGSPPQQLTICGLASIQQFRAIAIAANASITATYYRPRSP